MLGIVEKDVHRTDRNVALYAGDSAPHPDPDSPFAEIGTNEHLEQLKDILLTYNELNRSLGYVQGMSDLLSPLYAVFQDDAVTFWAFERFMDRMERNFRIDQSGMRSQLVALSHLVRFVDPALYRHLEKADSANFFCFFRMVLVWYKREFDFPDVMRLWDSFFTNYLSSDFHLFFALAILQKHRTVIMDHLQHFDEVLKYINELSGTMNLDELLMRAEALFVRFKRMVEAVDKKSNFPSAPTTISTSKNSIVNEDKSKLKMQAFQPKGKERAAPLETTAAMEVVTPELRALLSRSVAIRRSETEEQEEASKTNEWGRPVKKGAEIRDTEPVKEEPSDKGSTEPARIASLETKEMENGKKDDHEEQASP